jgi:hypothetical protein
MKCQSLHINENYRGFVVRKLKSMDWDHIRIFLAVARTAQIPGSHRVAWDARESPAQGRKSRSEAHSVFRTEEY